MGRGISHDDGWVIPPPIFFLFLTKRLRPQARVVGQPPHKRRHLGRRQTGRTRKGYAASVSGKAANGCAVDGPKEKIARRRTCAFAQVGLKRGSSECVPPGEELSYRHTANLGWLKIPLPAGRSLAEISRRARIPFSPLSAGAGLAEPRSPGETVYGFSGGPAMGFSFSGGPGNPLSPGGLVQAVPDKFCHQCADEPPRRHPRNNGGFLQQVIHRLVQPNLNLHALYRNHPPSFFW